MKTIARPLGLALALAGSAAALIAAAPPIKGNWLGVIAATPEGGHVRGNPKAEVKLVEYASYTCNHCAHFETESDAALQLSFIKNGRGSFEVRSFLRNPIDITASLMVQCGATAKVFGNHSAMLRSQAKWLRNPSQAEAARWSQGDFTSRMRAIASDLKLYDVMIPRGYTKVQLDQCLGNQALAARLSKQTDEAASKYNIQGTPSFLINGELVQGHDWAAVSQRLKALTR